MILRKFQFKVTKTPALRESNHWNAKINKDVICDKMLFLIKKKNKHFFTFQKYLCRGQNLPDIDIKWKKQH